MFDHEEVEQADKAWKAWGRDGALSQLGENLNEDTAEALMDDPEGLLESLGIDLERFNRTLEQYTPWSVANGEVHFDTPDSLELLKAYPELTNAFPSH